MKTKNADGLDICLISVHGLIRAHAPELGRDSDTGGQIKYVLELAEALSKRDDVASIELLTRQIIDDKVSRDYAQLEEPITDKAKIVRIPFGPKRYLYKERLWPYLDLFVDHILSHFRRRGGPPDIVHGHYADAGYAGGQIARLLGIPFIFTGHSLGRVKKGRLMEQGKSTEASLDRRFNFPARIEAEEFALETASLVVTSTHQEVEQQYALYDHYVPERMEVIPPGVSLESFQPPVTPFEPPRIAGEINRFLHESDKPMILAMARPDERKNLNTLVEVYGECDELRRLANLVLVMGNREDIRDLAPGQRKVLYQILTLIDYYDLYGSIAYPKQHRWDDVPEIYRTAAASGGVFINPAYTEPFGLTLLEAAACGLPIIAPDDGGPRDILANCNNGQLIDPFDKASIERALIRSLTEPDQWRQWAASGITGSKSHYAWDRHAERLLRDIKEIRERFIFKSQPTIETPRRARRIPDIDRLIVTDIDDTLTGDDAALRAFVDLIANTQYNVGFGIATGRSYDDVMDLIGTMDLPQPDVTITDVGTEIHYGTQKTADASWFKLINFRWSRNRVMDTLKDIEGLYIQEAEHQSAYKVSYGFDPEQGPPVDEIRSALRAAGLRVNLIFSHGMFLDVIPVRAGPGMAIRHIAVKWGFPFERILVAGDSGNDEGMLSGSTLGVVVSNYSVELEKLRGYPRVYFSPEAHARGLIDGIGYYNFLDHITIPNERTDEVADASEAADA